MLKFAGRVVLFVFAYWLGFLLLSLAAFGQFAAFGSGALGSASAWVFFWFLIIVPVGWAGVVGYLASQTSDRGPAVSLVAGLIVGYSSYWSSLRHAAPLEHFPVDAQVYLGTLDSVATALGCGLGGLLQHWRGTASGRGVGAIGFAALYFYYALAYERIADLIRRQDVLWAIGCIAAMAAGVICGALYAWHISSTRFSRPSDPRLPMFVLLGFVAIGIVLTVQVAVLHGLSSDVFTVVSAGIASFSAGYGIATLVRAQTGNESCGAGPTTSRV